MLPYEVFVEEQEHDNDGHDHEHEQSNVETQTREPDSPVYKLHCINKFGHPANSTLARTLRWEGQSQRLSKLPSESSAIPVTGLGLLRIHPIVL